MAAEDPKGRDSETIIEDASLLEEDPLKDGGSDDDLTPGQAWCMYLSHFLSMWNSRTYEYGAVLFAQHTWPGDLLPSSIIGISETICVLFSSAAIGRWVDLSPTRLPPLLISIVANRVTLVINCALWLFVFVTNQAWLQKALFGVILTLGMIEKTTRMSNMLSFERDWIPTVASYPLKDGSCGPYDLTHLNTVVRRIDIACKFLAPLATSGSMAIFSPTTVASIVAGVSLISVCIEVLTALRVWHQNPRLRAPKPHLAESEGMKLFVRPADSGPLRRVFDCMLGCVAWLIGVFKSQAEGFTYYFGTNVWVPSIGVAILHASVLAWAGTLVTYLLNAGFTYAEVTGSKAVGSVFEIGSTFVFPWAVTFLTRRMGPLGQQGTYKLVSKSADDEDSEATEPGDDAASDVDETLIAEQLAQDPSTLRPIVVTAKWGIIGLCASLIPAVIALFALDAAISPSSSSSSSSSPDSEEPPPDALARAPLLSLTFFAFLSLSFLGRWTYDLSVTQLTQTLIPASHRSEFGGAEMALVALISFAHWLAAAVWHAQADFRWLGAGSLAAVAVATVAYTLWIRTWEAWLASGSRV